MSLCAYLITFMMFLLETYLRIVCHMKSILEFQIYFLYTKPVPIAHCKKTDKLDTVYDFWNAISCQEVYNANKLLTLAASVWWSVLHERRLRPGSWSCQIWPASSVCTAPPSPHPRACWPASCAGWTLNGTAWGYRWSRGWDRPAWTPRSSWWMWSTWGCWIYPET